MSLQAGVAFPATALGGLSWHLAIRGLWLLGGLRLPLGHIPHEIGGPPAFDTGILGGQSWAPSDLGLAAQQGAGGRQKGLSPLSPHAQEVFWKTRHPSPPGPGWVCGAMVPPAPRGHPGHPRPHSLWRGGATVLRPQRLSRGQGSCGQRGLVGGVSCLLCPPCQSPVVSPNSPGLTHMPQGPSRPEWARPRPRQGCMKPTARSQAAVG